MAGHSVVTLRGHAHTTTATFGAPDTVFDGSNCGSGVIRWCAHHLQQLGPPWGIGGNAPTPQGWQDTAWSPSGGTHTPPQPLSALPTPYSTVRIGCRSVVCTPSSAARAAMGHWGQCPHTPGMAGHSLVTLRGHTHTTTTTFGAPDTVFDGSNCGSGVVRWCAH